MNSKRFKNYRFLIVILLAYLTIGLINPAMAQQAATRWVGFLYEVLMIVPPVLLLMGLLDVWVPRAFIQKNLGPDAGFRGVWLAMLLGTVAAGPLYAAFPIALTLRNKGARLACVVIFLGTWATIKIPMLLMESSFIGPRFALVRLLLTVPGVIAAGFLMERMLPADALVKKA